MIKFENKNNGRYYYLIIEKDLFDDFILCVLRGGRNHRRIIRQFVHPDHEEINREIQRITRIRLKRGYTLVN